jgi:hypothetical protein
MLQQQNSQLLSGAEGPRRSAGFGVRRSKANVFRLQVSLGLVSDYHGRWSEYVASDVRIERHATCLADYIDRGQPAVTDIVRWSFGKERVLASPCFPRTWLHCTRSSKL